MTDADPPERSTDRKAESRECGRELSGSDTMGNRTGSAAGRHLSPRVATLVIIGLLTGAAVGSGYAVWGFHAEAAAYRKASSFTGTPPNTVFDRRMRPVYYYDSELSRMARVNSAWRRDLCWEAVVWGAGSAVLVMVGGFIAIAMCPCRRSP